MYLRIITLLELEIIENQKWPQSVAEESHKSGGLNLNSGGTCGCRIELNMGRNEWQRN